jgi:transposase InsO family protein
MKALGDQQWLAQGRRDFVLAVQRGEADFATLCRRFRFSRQTGYKFWHRYRTEGDDGLRSRSRAPHQHGRSRLPHWLQQVRELRHQHRTWGAKKIHAALPGRARPAVSTVGRWLQQSGLSVRRRPRPRRGPAQPPPPLTPARRSNQVWTVDFKGSFCTADGTRLHPLTVRDLFSRYVLCVRAWPYQREAPVRHLFRRLFRRYGRPRVIRCDHGVPWSSTGPLGLSRLSVWWWSLGVRVEFTAKGHPEQNAAHEQHHRVLKAETLRPPAATSQAQQQRFQRWRHYYNYQRPHEGLQQHPPASRYHPQSKRPPLAAAVPRYGRAVAVRQVHPNGEIVWEGRRRFIGDALAGQRVGLFAFAQGIWSVRFLDLELGHLHRTDPGAMRPAFQVRAPKVSAM